MPVDREKVTYRGLNAVTLLEIATTTEELNVVYCARAPLTVGNNMIEFKVIVCATLHTSSLITLPDSCTHILWNTSAITSSSLANELTLRYTC